MNPADRSLLDVLRLKGATEAMDMLKSEDELLRVSLIHRAGVAQMQAKAVLDSMLEKYIVTRTVMPADYGFDPFVYKRGPMYDEAYAIMKMAQGFEQRSTAMRKRQGSQLYAGSI